MSLNERKVKILNAIIKDYIATAEPVGSRTIAKKYDMGISSATIRNEMSDLEEMGLIIQPHSSAGRIPSDMGYRMYVDRFMKLKGLNRDEESFLKKVVTSNINQIDFLMEETAKAISMITNYTTIISEPVITRTKLKKISLIGLDSESIMIIIATEGNFVKNYIVKESHLADDELYYISNVANRLLLGLTLNDIDDRLITRFASELSGYGNLIKEILKAVRKTINSAESTQLHLSGTKNILAFPEFSDVHKAKTLFQALEEKSMLITLLGETMESDMQIIIGNENNIEGMRDCSLITTTYRLGENTKGSIGVLGPTRMDYSQVVSALSSVARNIEAVIRAFGQKSKDT